LNPYLNPPLRADQVVSGFAGVRPLVAAPGVTDTKKLIRDDELEYDAKSGLVSILGGKWTTHRLMGQETIDKVQESIGDAITPSPTTHHPLSGSADYQWDYWQTLADQFKLPVATAKHLAHKYGTRAPDVLGLVDSDSSLTQLLVEGEAPIRAQVVYAARKEMALTIEDVLTRRIGLQLYGWRLAILAAPAVAEILRHELGWSDEQEASALDEYVAKVNHMLTTAGLEPVTAPITRDLVMERS
jgi:glycerol-3-phosphate dehydrogenase